MTYSRVDKLVRELRRLPSLALATRARGTPVDLVLAPDDSGKVAVMAWAAVSMALRCHTGLVRVWFPGREPHGLSGQRANLPGELEHEATIHGEPGRLEFHRGSPPPGPSLGLAWAVPGGIWADADGWMAGVNLVFAAGRPAAAPAAVFAVCCAMAKLFNLTVLGNDAAAVEAWRLSLLSLEPTGPDQGHGLSLDQALRPDLDLGDLVLVGAGAIGAGFAATLRLSGWSARLDIIDHDRYEEPNLETTLLVGRADVLARRQKATALADRLAGCSGLQVTSRAARVEDVLPSPAGDGGRVLVSAVDSRAARRHLDRVQAKSRLNGAVGGAAHDAGHVLWSRHGPEDPPLADLYPDEAEEERTATSSPPAEASDPCCRLAYEGVTMAVPFVGLAAGALLAAGCARLALGDDTAVNYFRVSLLGLQRRCTRRVMSRNSGCGGLGPPGAESLDP